ncbi:hypothetical protein TVAG_008910 [Trichomonas vaginalis G3]|uniref:Uncharacterized protein n=1 Tax=Trichomonas vaginalis (strain ATCC PRA-98 / G3) TaxID=412133 RepID=A2FGT6_TRIV3|nr:hypothetical protein TVAGG3_0313680 [Trichomonas vaginalis G3]EAX95880.1 hypothetical protein TVAG_008910 [Trichomonas vaginalis G3]KAI5528793.1 hypothetical protein TVAGG3_0313680 [Trichomonas vaginalis G3]|eukprot:XP_001308810.1 hypothetical protein [Trichomonas vaginalis G3]
MNSLSKELISMNKELTMESFRLIGIIKNSHIKISNKFMLYLTSFKRKIKSSYSQRGSVLNETDDRSNLHEEMFQEYDNKVQKVLPIFGEMDAIFNHARVLSPHVQSRPNGSPSKIIINTKSVENQSNTNKETDQMNDLVFAKYPAFQNSRINSGYNNLFKTEENTKKEEEKAIEDKNNEDEIPKPTGFSNLVKFRNEYIEQTNKNKSVSFAPMPPSHYGNRTSIHSPRLKKLPDLKPVPEDPNGAVTKPPTIKRSPRRYYAKKKFSDNIEDEFNSIQKDMQDNELDETPLDLAEFVVYNPKSEQFENTIPNQEENEKIDTQSFFVKQNRDIEHKNQRYSNPFEDYINQTNKIVYRNQKKQENNKSSEKINLDQVDDEDTPNLSSKFTSSGKLKSKAALAIEKQLESLEKTNNNERDTVKSFVVTENGVIITVIHDKNDEKTQRILKEHSTDSTIISPRRNNKELYRNNSIQTSESILSGNFVYFDNKSSVSGEKSVDNSLITKNTTDLNNNESINDKQIEENQKLSEEIQNYLENNKEMIENEQISSKSNQKKYSTISTDSTDLARGDYDAILLVANHQTRKDSNKLINDERISNKQNDLLVNNKEENETYKSINRTQELVSSNKDNSNIIDNREENESMKSNEKEISSLSNKEKSSISNKLTENIESKSHDKEISKSVNQEENDISNKSVEKTLEENEINKEEKSNKSVDKKLQKNEISNSVNKEEKPSNNKLQKKESIDSEEVNESVVNKEEKDISNKSVDSNSVKKEENSTKSVDKKLRENEISNSVNKEENVITNQSSDDKLQQKESIDSKEVNESVINKEEKDISNKSVDSNLVEKEKNSTKSVEKKSQEEDISNSVNKKENDISNNKLNEKVVESQEINKSNNRNESIVNEVEKDVSKSVKEESINKQKDLLSKNEQNSVEENKLNDESKSSIKGSNQSKSVDERNDEINKELNELNENTKKSTNEEEISKSVEESNNKLNNEEKSIDNHREETIAKSIEDKQVKNKSVDENQINSNNKSIDENNIVGIVVVSHKDKSKEENKLTDINNKEEKVTKDIKENEKSIVDKEKSIKENNSSVKNVKDKEKLEEQISKSKEENKSINNKNESIDEENKYSNQTESVQNIKEENSKSKELKEDEKSILSDEQISKSKEEISKSSKENTKSISNNDEKEKLINNSKSIEEVNNKHNEKSLIEEQKSNKFSNQKLKEEEKSTKEHKSIDEENKSINNSKEINSFNEENNKSSKQIESIQEIKDKENSKSVNVLKEEERISKSKDNSINNSKEEKSIVEEENRNNKSSYQSKSVDNLKEENIKSSILAEEQISKSSKDNKSINNNKHDEKSLNKEEKIINNSKENKEIEEERRSSNKRNKSLDVENKEKINIVTEEENREEEVKTTQRRRRRSKSMTNIHIPVSKSFDMKDDNKKSRKGKRHKQQQTVICDDGQYVLIYGESGSVSPVSPPPKPLRLKMPNNFDVDEFESFTDEYGEHKKRRKKRYNVITDSDTQDDFPSAYFAKNYDDDYYDDNDYYDYNSQSLSDDIYIGESFSMSTTTGFNDFVLTPHRHKKTHVMYRQAMTAPGGKRFENEFKEQIDEDSHDSNKTHKSMKNIYQDQTISNSDFKKSDKDDSSQQKTNNAYKLVNDEHITTPIDNIDVNHEIEANSILMKENQAKNIENIEKNNNSINENTQNNEKINNSQYENKIDSINNEEASKKDKHSHRRHKSSILSKDLNNDEENNRNNHSEYEYYDDNDEFEYSDYYAYYYITDDENDDDYTRYQKLTKKMNHPRIAIRKERPNIKLMRESGIKILKNRVHLSKEDKEKLKQDPNYLPKVKIFKKLKAPSLQEGIRIEKTSEYLKPQDFIPEMALQAKKEYSDYTDSQPENLNQENLIQENNNNKKMNEDDLFQKILMRKVMSRKLLNTKLKMQINDDIAANQALDEDLEDLDAHYKLLDFEYKKKLRENKNIDSFLFSIRVPTKEIGINTDYDNKSISEKQNIIESNNYQIISLRENGPRIIASKEIIENRNKMLLSQKEEIKALDQKIEHLEFSIPPMRERANIVSPQKRMRLNVESEVERVKKLVKEMDSQIENLIDIDRLTRGKVEDLRYFIDEKNKQLSEAQRRGKPDGLKLIKNLEIIKNNEQILQNKLKGLTIENEVLSQMKTGEEERSKESAQIREEIAEMSKNLRKLMQEVKEKFELEQLTELIVPEELESIQKEKNKVNDEISTTDREIKNLKRKISQLTKAFSSMNLTIPDTPY